MAYANPNLLPESGSSFEGNSSTWTTGSNTTGAVISGSALAGTYSYRLTATAAGSVNGTSPRALVTAGTEYVAMVPIKLNTSTATKSATVTVTWYNAASGGSSLGTTVSAANPLPTGTGWFNTTGETFTVAIGSAPVGALSATASLTVSGMNASESVQVDLVTFCATNRTPGNLFSFNAQSIEANTAGWSVTNGTKRRLAGVIDTDAGYFMLEVVSAAAGAVPITSTETAAVTPGAEYVAYAVFYSVAGGVSVDAEIQWYDAGAALISSELRTRAVTSATFNRLCVVGTAPAGAATAKLVIKPTATSASQVFYLESFSLRVAPNAAGNLLTFDEFSSESELGPWVTDLGSVSRSALVSQITDGYFGVSLVPAGTGIHRMELDRLLPVTAGTTYAFLFTSFRETTSAEAITWHRRGRIDWYDAGSNLLLADVPDQFYTNVETGPSIGGWNSITRTAPDGAAFAKVSAEFQHDQGLIDNYLIDNMTFMESTPEYTVVTDNETGSITLTVEFIPDPATYDIDTVTVVRMDEDGRATPMRTYGAEFTDYPYTGSAMVIEDYESPLASKVWYSIKYSIVGSEDDIRLQTRLIGAPVLTNADYVWFKSPGIPALNTRVMMEAPVKWSRAARSGRFDIVGRKNPIHITGVRGGRTSSMSILVWDAASNAQFNSLLDSGLPVLIQAMPGFGLDGNTYLAVGDADVDPLSPDAREQGWRWTLEISEIDRPGGGLQGSALSTWQTVLDNPEWSTWEDVFEAEGYSTWADVLTKG